MTRGRAGVTAPTVPSRWTFAEPWGARGFVSDLGTAVHWIEFDGPASGPPFVYVHGLGGSHLNWVDIGPELAKGRHGYALDLAGFGLSQPSGRSTSVQANAALLHRFLREVVGEPAILVGNSMGGMITLLHTAAHPSTVAGAVLVDPSIPVPKVRPDLAVLGQFALFALPGVGEFYLKTTKAKASSRQQVMRTLNLCFADPSRADPKMIDAGVALADTRATFRGTEASFLQAARSLVAVLARSTRYKAVIASIDVPVLLIHGDQDRLVPFAAARALARSRPDWDTAFLTGVGHTPQLEVPDVVIQRIQRWIEDHPGLTSE
jgi:pimeloyl-ACP methyl ester carboxylesterase